MASRDRPASQGDRKDRARKVSIIGGKDYDKITVDDLSERERDLLFKIGSFSHRPKVEEIVPNFTRGTEDHGWLHHLREKEFISPVEGGRLRASKHLQLEAPGQELLEASRPHPAQETG